MVVKSERKFPLTKHLGPKSHCSPSTTSSVSTTSRLLNFPPFSIQNDKTSTALSPPRSCGPPPLRPSTPLPLHRATSAEVAELEKQGNETGIGSRSNILLQHKHIVRRRTSLFVPSYPRGNLPRLTVYPPVAVPPPSSPSDETSLPTLESVKSNSQKSSQPSVPAPDSTIDPETFEGTEQEASQEGAFNEETGEINWDCPCLGGMAQGPCGEQFKEAFSCFVFSKEEPKGMDCIGNFK